MVAITVTATAAELVAASNIMSYRNLGKMRRVVLVLAVYGGGLAGGLGVAAANGVSLSGATLVSVATMLGAFLGFVVVRQLSLRHQRATLNKSNTFGKPRGLKFDETGMTLSERYFPWSGFAGVQRWKEATLLMSSGADGFVIPDRDLPAGMTAADLAKMIEDWRRNAGQRAAG